MNIHVPHPAVKEIVTVVDDDQEITPEQRKRLVTWLSANGVAPACVSLGKITVEYSVYGTRKGRQFIGFHQYYTEEGSKVFDPVNNRAATFHRYVEQHTELEPDPSWEGWEAWNADMAERRKKQGEKAQ